MKGNVFMKILGFIIWYLRIKIGAEKLKGQILIGRILNSRNSRINSKGSKQF